MSIFDIVMIVLLVIVFTPIGKRLLDKLDC